MKLITRSLRTSLVSTAIGLTTLLVGTVAFAAEPEPNAGTPATGAPKPADAQAPAAGAPVGEELRLRIGFNVGAGPIVGSASGFGLGVGFRVGAQFNRLLGAYVQTGGNVLLAATAGSLQAASFVPISPMVSLTPIDQIEIAAGPSIDYYGAASAGTGGASAGGGVAFGIAGRLALHLGSRNETTGRRSGFAIGVDVHPIFVSGGALVPITFGIGGDWL